MKLHACSRVVPAFFFQGHLDQRPARPRRQTRLGHGSVSTYAQLIWRRGARLADNLLCAGGLDLFGISVTPYCFITSWEDHKHCLKDLPDETPLLFVLTALKILYPSAAQNEAEAERS